MARDEGTVHRSARGLGEIEWELEPSRSGAIALKLGGHYVESRYDPVKSAASTTDSIGKELRTSRADLVVLVGAGLGHVITKLRSDNRATLVVWDPFPEVREQLVAVGHRLPSPSAGAVHGKQRHRGASLHYVSLPEELDDVLKQLAPTHQRPHLAIHPGHSAICRFEARYASRALRHRFGRKRALKLEDAIVSRRSFRILRSLPFCRTTEDLGQLLAGHTAIIASAGPSLGDACEPLARRSGGALFACVQALESLARANAHVNFATCADPSDIFRARRVNDSVPYDALLADTSSTPAMIESRIERSFLFHMRTPHFHQIPWEACNLPVIDEPCLTVSEIGLLLAHSMGARRFVLVGVDYRSQDPRYRERIVARDSDGNPASTNSHYFHGSRYMNFICKKLIKEGTEIFRLGEGLSIGGVKPIDASDLDQLLADLPGFQGPKAMPWFSRERLAAVEEVVTAIGSPSTSMSSGRDAKNDLSRFRGDFSEVEPSARREVSVECLRALRRMALQREVAPGRRPNSSQRDVEPTATI